jgi:hypothetical protein
LAHLEHLRVVLEEGVDATLLDQIVIDLKELI